MKQVKKSHKSTSADMKPKVNRESLATCEQSTS
jgi:hypothetical protein